jgi:hypothetical protein
MSRSAAKQTDLFAHQPAAESGSSLTDADQRRIRLPGDLSVSLKYVDNAELERLREAVSSEISRRGLSLQTEPATLPSLTDHRSVLRSKKQPEPSEIPVGKASLIHAAFKAGLQPAAIARSLRISPSLVHEVLRSAKKPKRNF